MTRQKIKVEFGVSSEHYGKLEQLSSLSKLPIDRVVEAILSVGIDEIIQDEKNGIFIETFFKKSSDINENE